MNKKLAILLMPLLASGLTFAAAYAENNSVSNIIFAVYDLVVAMIEAFLPYTGSLVGVAVLGILLSMIVGILAMVVGLIFIFTRMKHK